MSQAPAGALRGVTPGLSSDSSCSVCATGRTCVPGSTGQKGAPTPPPLPSSYAMPHGQLHRDILSRGAYADSREGARFKRCHTYLLNLKIPAQRLKRWYVRSLGTKTGITNPRAESPVKVKINTNNEHGDTRTLPRTRTRIHGKNTRVQERSPHVSSGTRKARWKGKIHKSKDLCPRHPFVILEYCHAGPLLRPRPDSIF